MTSARMMTTRDWVDKHQLNDTTPHGHQYENYYLPKTSANFNESPKIHNYRESNHRTRKNGLSNKAYHHANGGQDVAVPLDSRFSTSIRGERSNPLFVQNDSTSTTSDIYPPSEEHGSVSNKNSGYIFSEAKLSPITFLSDTQKDSKTSLQSQKVYKKYPMYLPKSDTGLSYLNKLTKLSDSGVILDENDFNGAKLKYISERNKLERVSKSQILPPNETKTTDSSYHERTTVSNPDLSFLNGLRVPENVAGNRISLAGSVDSGINSVNRPTNDEEDSFGSGSGTSSKKVSAGDSGLSNIEDNEDISPSTSNGFKKPVINIISVDNNALDTVYDEDAVSDVAITSGFNNTLSKDESLGHKDNYFIEKPERRRDSISLASESSKDNNSEILRDIERNVYPVAKSDDGTSSISTISDQFQFLEQENDSLINEDIATIPTDGDLDRLVPGVSDDPLPVKEDTGDELYVHLHVTKERIKEFMDEVRAQKENEGEESDGESASEEAIQIEANQESESNEEKSKNSKENEKKPFKWGPLVVPQLENLEPGEGPGDMAELNEVVIDLERIVPAQRYGETSRIVTADLAPGITSGVKFDETNQSNAIEDESGDDPNEKVQISRYLPPVKKSLAPRITLAYRIIYIAGSVGIIIGAMAAFYALNIRLVRVGLGVLPWALTVYGVVTMGHYISESFFAVFNKLKMNRLGQKVQGEERAKYRCKGKVALQIVGYREDPEYFRNCIISARDCNGPIYVLCVVVDGHEEQDAYMAETITEVFGPDNVMQVILDDLAANIDEEAWQELVVKPVADYLGDGSDYTGAIRGEGCENTFKVITIRQFHEGKRSVMHCAMRLLIDVGIDYIMMTDSDTLLDPDCLAHLSNLLESDDNLGAVTGNVGIFNANESPISFLSAVKYWYAFNIERAAQSLFGVVSCVSGPLGLYRCRDLKVILHDWYFQTFLGVPCTYGDDRHLTNRILSLGRTVQYTHLATCTTETPTQVIRWIVQQTRWTKSFFRELGFNLWWAYKVNFYLTWVLLYQGVYPFFVSASIITLLFSKSPNSMGTLLVVMIVVSTFRAVLATSLSGQPRLLVYIIYSFLYVIFMIPTKMHAVLMLWDTGWGTSSRLTVAKGNPVHLTPVLLWCSLLLAGILYNLATNLWVNL